MLMDLPSLIFYRADVDGGPKFAAVLSPVVDLRIGLGVAIKAAGKFAFGRSVEGCFDVGEDVAMRAPREERVKAVAEHFGAIVPGEREEAVVRENDAIVGAVRVRKQHRHPRCLSRGDEWAELLPKAVDISFGC
jgi:hypothetical protein